MTKHVFNEYFGKLHEPDAEVNVFCTRATSPSRFDGADCNILVVMAMNE